MRPERIGGATLYRGDCRRVLATLPDASVHCCVTSPPYFGLRDYGTAAWRGGDPACDHLMPSNGVRDKGRDRAVSGGTFHDSPVSGQIRQQFASSCRKCGATRTDAQIGLERTPDEYVAALVGVFREVRRVRARRQGHRHRAPPHHRPHRRIRGRRVQRRGPHYPQPPEPRR